MDSYTAALGHDQVVTPGYAATCTEDGLTDAIHCGRCGLVIQEHQVIPSNGAHEWHGLECLRCGAVRENPFTDTDPLGFYFEAVLWAVENGITTGATDTTFDPNGKCLRSQVVTFLWRASNCPEPTSTVNPFTDVKEKHYFYKPVLWAVENEITTGMTQTTFVPYNNCSRGEVVTFLWRAAGSPEPTVTEHPFTDVKESRYYYKAMLWAVENGITNGLTATTFGPNELCTRAQVVTFLYRALSEK